jgi:hypothetical protein
MLDDQLSEIFNRLGVVQEGAEMADTSEPRHDYDPQEVSSATLFQTSREHQGTFYRLDLIADVPMLRVFSPDEGTSLRMRCDLVKPAEASPVQAWFDAVRMHDGSQAFDDDVRFVTDHLLFAAGEALKRLYWAGERAGGLYPQEIDVARLA